MQRKWGITKIVKALGFSKSNLKGGRHNCDATLKKVMLALDDELSDEEEKALLEEVKSCSYCLQKFEIEKTFKEYLCQKIKRHAVPSNITEQIRARIRSNMDH
jgi:anti-sigma factor (TIGR02949 family)